MGRRAEGLKRLFTYDEEYKDIFIILGVSVLAIVGLIILFIHNTKAGLITLGVLVLLGIIVYFRMTDNPEERRMTEEEKMEARIAYDKAMVSYREGLKKGLRLHVVPPKCKRPKDFYEKVNAMEKKKGLKKKG